MNFKNILYILIITLILSQNTKIYAYKNLKKIKAKSYILIEHNSGMKLIEEKIKKKCSPASLTKIMTSYIIGDLIKKNKIKNSNLVKIKNSSWTKINPIFKNSSLMFINKNDIVKISDLKKGIIIQSGNDACVAIANYISQNQENFIKLMNKYVKKNNLKNTNFTTTHGLDNFNQYTSAEDISILSSYLIKTLPEEYKIYKEKYFTFNKVKQKNRNNLLWDKTLNVDGIKTGHTENAGYNLAASSFNKNMRLISVILGTKSIGEREKYNKILINLGLKNFKTKKILISKKKLLKYKNNIYIGTYQNIYITFPKNIKKEFIKINFIFYKNKKLFKKINQFQIIGKISIKTKYKKKTKNYPLIILNKIKQKNILKNIKKYIIHIIKKYFILNYVN